jgi:hypothetical protein
MYEFKSKEYKNPIKFSLMLNYFDFLKIKTLLFYIWLITTYKKMFCNNCNKSGNEYKYTSLIFFFFFLR